VPNTRMASDTIRNATLRSFEHRAQITVPVPVGTDLDRVREILVEEARRAPEAMSEKSPVATLTQLDATSAVFTVDAWAKNVGQAAKLASTVRVSAYKRLQAEGIYA
jgi:potassium efflux system protein